MVYRLHLGSIFGHRLLLLSHRGRKSGRTHRTILEVGQYDRLRGEAIVITPWPTRAEWYLNIQAAPASELAIAGRRYRPCQRFLAAPELARLLDITPPKGRRLEAVGLERLIGWRRDLDEPSRIVVLASLGGVAFGELRGGSTHPERYARLAFSPIG
jgi:deazaflavin-dependent oxidoreductase (nitroreductase family)